MITGKTSSGFEYAINEEFLIDYRYIKLVNAVTDAKTDADTFSAMSKWITATLGEDQEEKLVEHIAKHNNGHVPFDMVFEEFQEIINNNKEVKN